MKVKTCDLCCEPIGEISTEVYINADVYQQLDLCEICSAPLVRYLREVKLVTRPPHKISRKNY
jgi:hypothetical protein